MAETQTVTTNPTQTADPQAPVPMPDAESIHDHAAQFQPGIQESEEDQKPAVVEPPKSPAQQRRDRETGQWREGKVRHRAKSQQASPEDVPRIRELTAKQRAAEEKAAALEQELARYRSQPQTPAPIQQAPPELRQPERQAPPPQTGAQPWDDPNDPEPDENDPKYAENYGQFLKDQARQAGRAENRRIAFLQWQHSQRQQHATSWTERAQAVKAEHPDFDEVLAQANQNPGIRAHFNTGSPLDRYLQFAPSGPKMLYYLHTHPEELDSLNRMQDGFQLMESLALLSQRLLSNPSPAAGSNGAAPATKPVIVPPKPPTPLRTEAQRPDQAPPPTDGSLSIREHERQFGRRKAR